MALIQSLTIGNGKLYIWHITESLEELTKDVDLTFESIKRLKIMKSIEHKKAFLAIRNILNSIGLTDDELFYDKNGKPYLKNERHISISHSFTYAVIYLADFNIGVDIEKKQEKIIRLASKFCNNQELALKPLDKEEQLNYFTQIWSAKEAVYKMCNSRSLSFAKQIAVDNVDGTITVEGESETFYFETVFLEDFLIVCSFIN